MANLSNINNKFLVTTGGNVLIGQTGTIGSSIFQVTGNATFAGTITSGTLSVGTSGTSRFTATNAYPLQLNRGLAVDVVGAAGTILGLGAYSTGTTYIDSGRLTCVLKANGVDGDMSFQVLNSGTHSTVLSLNNSLNATFAGNINAASNSFNYQLDSSGNALLDLSSSGGQQIRFIDTNSSYTEAMRLARDDYKLSLTYGWNANEEALTVIGGTGSDVGFVGIGTTSPANKLDVKISTGNRTTLEPVMSVSANGSGPYTGFGPKISFSSNIYYGAATGNPAGIIETAYIGAVMGVTYATNSDLVFATRDGATSVTEKMRILGNGNVGIGTISPSHDLQIGTAATNGSYSMMIEGNFANTALASNPRLNLIDTNFGITAGKYGSGGADDALGIFGFQGAGRGILFAHTTAGSSTHLKDMRHDMFIDGGTGDVGIGTTSPNDILDVRSASWATRIQSTADGSYLRISPNQIATFNSGNSGSPLYVNNSSSGNIIMAGGGGYVGIGITNPQDKLHVSGGGAIIGSTRFRDSATASMNTTGYIVANVPASTNGQSAIVEFVASGNNGGYYNVVYSCYNGGGVWYYTKNVVGSGGNIEVAETNGSGSSTLVFYFRATSGSASYTPRVMMRGTPYALVTF